MNHNLSHLSLTGLTNHDGITRNFNFSFFGNNQSKYIDPGKSSLRFNFFSYGADGGVCRRHDVYH